MIGATEFYLTISALLFAIGAAGMLLRRNPLVMFMSIELMLNGVNLAFLTFARLWDNPDGDIFTFLVLTVAAAEAVVGLAIIIAIFRPRQGVDVDEIDEMKGLPTPAPPGGRGVCKNPQPLMERGLGENVGRGNLASSDTPAGRLRCTGPARSAFAYAAPIGRPDRLW